MVSFTPLPSCHWETASGTQCRGSWVGPRAGLDVINKNPLPPTGTEPRSFRSPARSLVAIQTKLYGSLILEVGQENINQKLIQPNAKEYSLYALDKLLLRDATSRPFSSVCQEGAETESQQGWHHYTNTAEKKFNPTWCHYAMATRDPLSEQ
jgi:hypothetical protein